MSRSSKSLIEVGSYSSSAALTRHRSVSMQYRRLILPLIRSLSRQSPQQRADSPSPRRELRDAISADGPGAILSRLPEYDMFYIYLRRRAVAADARPRIAGESAASNGQEAPADNIHHAGEGRAE